MTTFFLNRLATESHALAFAGQSTPWPVALADQTTDPSLDEPLRGHVVAAGRLLTPVAADLLATTGRPVDLFGFTPNPARLGAAADATASVEGVALTQLGALLDLEHLGYSVAQAKPLAVLGHSQGVLAVHMARAIEAAGSIEAAGKTLDEILAVAALIGAAGTRRVRELGLNPKYGEASPMLSVKGATREARSPSPSPTPTTTTCFPATRKTWQHSPSKPSASTSTRPSCVNRSSTAAPCSTPPSNTSKSPFPSTLRSWPKLLSRPCLGLAPAALTRIAPAHSLRKCCSTMWTGMPASRRCSTPPTRPSCGLWTLVPATRLAS